VTPDERAKILFLLDEGQPRQEIARQVGVTIHQVSAVLAHRTMGTYGSPVQKQVASGIAPPTRASVSVQVPLGFDVATHESVAWDLASVANPHLLIVGESGFGKTYSIQCILRELSAQRVGAVIFDFGQGFSAPADGGAQMLDLGRTGVALNPFAIHTTDLYGPISVAQRIADSFARVYPRLGVQQHALLRTAIVETFEDVGVTDDRSTWHTVAPTLSSLEAKLRQYASQGDATTRRTAAAVASHVSTLFVFNVFREGGSRIDWNKLLGEQITIIQFRGLEPAVSKLVTEFLLWNLIQFAESAGPHPLRGLLILDEAHRLSADEGSPVEKLLREARKFGVGLILASQQPEDFTSVAISNTATKLIFQVTDARGAFARVVGRKVHNLGWPEITATITRLPRGHALFISKNHGSVIAISPIESRDVQSVTVKERKRPR